MKNTTETAHWFINNHDIKTLGLARSMVFYADHVDATTLLAPEKEQAESADTVLSKHIYKASMDELSENIWPDMLDALAEFSRLQNAEIQKKLDEAVKKNDLYTMTMNGILNQLDEARKEIERLEEIRRDNVKTIMELATPDKVKVEVSDEEIENRFPCDPNKTSSGIGEDWTDDDVNGFHQYGAKWMRSQIFANQKDETE